MKIFRSCFNLRTFFSGFSSRFWHPKRARNRRCETDEKDKTGRKDAVRKKPRRLKQLLRKKRGARFYQYHLPALWQYARCFAPRFLAVYAHPLHRPDQGRTTARPGRGRAAVTQHIDEVFHQRNRTPNPRERPTSNRSGRSSDSLPHRSLPNPFAGPVAGLSARAEDSQQRDCSGFSPDSLLIPRPVPGRRKPYPTQI